MIRGEGPSPCYTLWVGHAPGEFELKTGRVWVGPAGSLLDTLLIKEGIFRDEIFITNLRNTMSRKGDGGPYCEMDRFEEELLRIEPYIIVTMGREAAQWFLGDVDLEAVHGILWKMPKGRWAEVGSSLNTEPLILPMYNPAFAMHDDEAYTKVAWDIKQAKSALDATLTPREIKDQYPKPKYSLGFADYTHDKVYVDTEGWKKRPWCLSYACIPGTAHVIRATDRVGLRKFQKWIAERRQVVLHSAMYDIEVLRAMGVEVRDDQIADTKVLAYETQIEPQGLKALGFRHAGMVMQDYTDLTRNYDFAQAMEYLRKVAEFDWGKPDPVFEMVAGKPYVKKPQGLNTRIKSIFTAITKGEEEEDGGKTNPRKRWFKIDEEIRLPAETQLGPMPDFSLDLVPLADAVHYAARDADATCRIYGPLTEEVMAGDNLGVYNLDIKALPIVERMQSNGLYAIPGYFPKLEAYFQKEMDGVRKKIEVFNNRKYINPGSSKQTAELLFGRLRLPITKLTKGRAPSTNDKVLESLRGRHDAVGLICDWRELATLKDKFAKQLPKYVDPDDGRVRGKIRDTTVVSGRYSMSEPNLMAIPVRTKIGKKIRSGFSAGAPDRMLGSTDYDQVEMRVMADESGDASMIAAFVEGRDIHSENASMMFGVKLESVDPLLHRYPAKRIGFGIITGITELGLYDQMRLAGIHTYSVGDCADMIQSYFRVRPGVDRYLKHIRSMAMRDGYIRDRGGRIRYLPGVFSRNPGVKEEALRQSHSHRISGTAQWIKKRGLARIWKEVRDLPRWECEPLLEIHDEFLFEFKRTRREWVGKMVTTCMGKDSSQFKVPIKAKFTAAETWGELKD